VFDLNVEEVGYVDFLGVDGILSNSPNNDYDEFYMVEKTFMFTREAKIGPFLNIFRACEKKMVHEASKI
jgi:hypothetical protein